MEMILCICSQFTWVFSGKHLNFTNINMDHYFWRPFPSEDVTFSNKFSSLLTTFARTGKPEFSMEEAETSFEWKSVDPNNIFHLNIGNEIRMDHGLPNHK